MAYSDEERKAAQDKLCHLIATGTQGIRSICTANPDLPNPATYMRWLDSDQDFCEQYTRAREEQADGIAGEIVTIVDAPLNGEGFVNKDGEEVDVSDHAQALRLELERRKQMVDARKWVASKLKPSVYGDKVAIEADVNMKLSDEQLDARLALLIGKAGAIAAARGEGTPEGSA